MEKTEIGTKVRIRWTSFTCIEHLNNAIWNPVTSSYDTNRVVTLWECETCSCIITNPQQHAKHSHGAWAATLDRREEF